MICIILLIIIVIILIFYKSKIQILDIPILTQETDYGCGAIAISAIMKSIYSNFNKTENEMLLLLKSEKDYGTKISEMMKFLNSYNISSHFIGNASYEIIGKLLPNNIIITEYQTDCNKPECGHYVIIVGINDKYIYFMDPLKNKYVYMNRDNFIKRWHGWYDDLPVMKPLLIIHKRANTKIIDINSLIHN